MKGGEWVAAQVKASVVAAETQAQETATSLAPDEQETLVAAG